MKESSLNKNFGNVNISTKTLPKRGTCLVATDKTSGMSIYMDYIGFAIADGQNAYLFGNKLIIVSRWSNFSKEDIANAKSGNISLGMIPLTKTLQLLIKFGDYPWGDVFTVHSIVKQMNDFSRPVDEIIFIFCDKSEGYIYAAESVATDEAIGEFLTAINKKIYEGFGKKFPAYHAFFMFKDFSKAEDLASIEEVVSSGQDWCDFLYDRSYDYDKEESSIIRSRDSQSLVDGVPGVIKIYIQGFKFKNMEINR